MFDGWGYAHLYRNTGKISAAVDPFAIEEALDERYAFGFGDLSVHEFATDPRPRTSPTARTTRAACACSFGADGLEEVGKFIDKGGNNFWGVEQFTTPRATA